MLQSFGIAMTTITTVDLWFLPIPRYLADWGVFVYLFRWKSSTGFSPYYSSRGFFFGIFHLILEGSKSYTELIFRQTECQLLGYAFQSYAVLACISHLAPCVGIFEVFVEFCTLSTV
ncbi:unnamed protein product [Dracunculus medinensis]|uniref:Protein TIC 20 n=1 Tax=Dracunculus medinensis TaxID=318479 RepID=A0A0N4U223_DRAME|nr:unnamed protein product [Dracunculus medinensis]